MIIPEIPFEDIDHIIDLVESDTDFLSRLEAELLDTNPVLLAYLFQDEFKVLTEPERSYLVFIALIIYKVIFPEGVEELAIDPENITNTEERNWELTQNAKDYDNTYEILYQDTSQTNVFDFIDEALDQEENPWISGDSKITLLIILKTWLDVLCNK